MAYTKDDVRNFLGLKLASIFRKIIPNLLLHLDKTVQKQYALLRLTVSNTSWRPDAPVLAMLAMPDPKQPFGVV